jgi:RHH-type proline utilization regulon transcriptional repressor/proline dehydrogenase/delta 1-pyrroline-5-carboxylate dehydrogenase
MPCAGSGVGSKLAAHKSVDAVILTGGTDTALKMLAARPDMNLLAETGGKDATIVTAMADRDQAIKNVLHSAFGHSGQKCSATSLLILEEEVYEDEEFRKTLCDAVRSLPVGPAWDRRTRVGPLIRPPEGALERGLKELDPGESWAVMPKQVGDNPGLWSPGVKWGVSAGSFMHMTELFGPVLAVMKANDLDHAIDLVNQTGYGLTSGLESLDDREQALWQARIRAGNLYINRPTTGAIVLRQPFGGMGKSAFGPGIKAGGPNYVAQFMDFVERGGPGDGAECRDSLLRDLIGRLQAEAEAGSDITAADCARLARAVASYEQAMSAEFGREHDHFRLVGQDNIRRYLAVGDVRIRVHPADSFFDLAARVAAARVAGSRVIVSSDPGAVLPSVTLLERLTESWGGALEFVEESDEQLAQTMRDGLARRIRYAAPDRVPGIVFGAAAEPGVFVARVPVLGIGRVELLWYLVEQSLSNSYHRYGNLGEHGGDDRARVL